MKANIIIIGGGPAGTTCALHLAKQKIPCILIDKAKFPRDKICGDALSGNTVFELEKLGGDVPSLFGKLKEKLPTAGIKFISPDGGSLFLKMKKMREGFSHAGYISERFFFDQFLMEMVKKESLITVIEDQQVQKVEVNNETASVYIKGHPQPYEADLVIGADGAHSAVRKLLYHEIDRNHYSGGLRQYWKNVEKFDEGNPIELHFFKKTLPGYFWVFPVDGNKANVGIGISTNTIAQKKINLKEMLNEIIKNEPGIQQRFKNAEPLEEPKGFGLPLGSGKGKISGNRFLLLGDAASLIDPFTGEGIGNAMVSGRVAAEHIVNCIHQNRFDEEFNTNYDKAIYKKIGGELEISFRLQKMLNKPWLFNWIVRKAIRNPHLHTFIEDMLENTEARKQITKVSFYYKLIFNPKKGETRSLKHEA